jgi:hypothetical protein
VTSVFSASSAFGTGNPAPEVGAGAADACALRAKKDLDDMSDGTAAGPANKTCEFNFVNMSGVFQDTPS